MTAIKTTNLNAMFGTSGGMYFAGRVTFTKSGKMRATVECSGGGKVTCYHQPTGKSEFIPALNATLSDFDFALAKAIAKSGNDRRVKGWTNGPVVNGKTSRNYVLS